MAVSPYNPPVGIPVFFQYLQAYWGYPPSHPKPQEEQQANKFSAETLVWRVCPDWMQILSLMASTAPKAQQEPQFAWSLISLIDSQFGYSSLGSKLSGNLNLFCLKVFSGSDSPPSRMAPNNGLKFLSYVLAFQVVFILLTVLAISS